MHFGTADVRIATLKRENDQELPLYIRIIIVHYCRRDRLKAAGHHLDTTWATSLASAVESHGRFSSMRVWRAGPKNELQTLALLALRFCVTF